MNSEITELIEAWNNIGKQYAEAFKADLKELARTLHLKMLEYARRLHELGVPLGLPKNEAAYITESLKSIMANPMSQMSRAVILEIPDILSRNLDMKPTPQPTLTMENFVMYELNSDGSKSIIEPTEPEPQPKEEYHLPIKNDAAQNKTSRYTRMRADGKNVGEDGFLRGE